MRVFQVAEALQIPNLLWDDPKWVAEELLCGYRAVLRVGPKSNQIEVEPYSSFGELLKDYTQHFPDLRDLDLSHLKGSEFDCLLVAPETQNKTFVKSLLSNGALGAEKRQFGYGSARLVLLDVFNYKGLDLRGSYLESRRLYLEDLVHDLDAKAKHFILLVPQARANKREFFDQICDLGAQGVVLKERMAVYQAGSSRAFLKVLRKPRARTERDLENMSLRTDLEISRAKTESLDWDVVLAIEQIHKFKG